MKTGQYHRFALCSALLLAACSQGGGEEPSVVLEKASSMAQRLQSAAYDVTFSYDTPALSARGSAKGSLAEAGRLLSAEFDGDLQFDMDGNRRSLSIEGEAIVAGENEAYVRISRLEGGAPFLPGIGMISDDSVGTWYLAGSANDVQRDITADPSFISAQTKALSVTRDRSYEKIDGQTCYVYDVELDPSKTVEFFRETAEKSGKPFDREVTEAFIASFQAKGTVWIDQNTYVLRRVTWDIESAPGSPDVRATFTLHLDKHDQPVEISPPESYKPLSELGSHISLPAL